MLVTLGVFVLVLSYRVVRVIPGYVETVGAWPEWARRLVINVVGTWGSCPAG